jgi:hypothetical protein
MSYAIFETVWHVDGHFFLSPAFRLEAIALSGHSSG